MKYDTRTLRILIAGDDASLLDTDGYRFLHRRGSVAWASNGDEAISWLTTHAFDAVLSNIDMSCRDGVLLIQAIRRRFPCLPVILVSRDARPDMRVSIDTWEADGLLVTPVNIDMLLSIIERACSQDEIGYPSECGETRQLTVLAS